MSTTEKKAATKFEKAGECLYRYQPNGVYYARLKRDGKQIWESLKTTGKAFASRKLREKQNELENVNPSDVQTFLSLHGKRLSKASP